MRELERDSFGLNWLNPYTGVVQTDITQALADPVQEQTLHMITADPMRTPTFTLFADPNWFFFATGRVPCATPGDCATIPPARHSTSLPECWDCHFRADPRWIGLL